MPNIDIDRSGIKIASKHFQKWFDILSNSSDGLFWLADRGSKKKAGLLWGRLWKNSQADKYQLDLVGGEWQLVIDGTPLQQAHYLNFDVTGKLVEIANNTYHFVCAMPSQVNPYPRSSPVNLLYSNPASLAQLASMSVTVHIFKAEKKVDEQTFLGNFRILKKEMHDLYWESDKERDKTEAIFIYSGTLGEYYIDTVLPEWQLTVNGIMMGRGLYSNIWILGKVIELEFNEYRFVIQFPYFEGQYPINYRVKDSPLLKFFPSE